MKLVQEQEEPSGTGVALRLIGLGTLIAIIGVAVLIALVFGVTWAISAGWRMGAT